MGAAICARHQGRITTWKDDQGFGFITPLEAGKQVFVHITSFSSRARRPELDALVTYELGMDDNGRPQAKSVAFAGERIKAPSGCSGTNHPSLRFSPSSGSRLCSIA
ncbi:MAG: cold shock domain-containing protein [Castellaniella sp.]